MSIIRDEGESMISIFIIDRLACGSSFELIRNEYKKYFKEDLSKEVFDKYCSKYAAEVNTRREEIKDLIYRSGTYSKLIDISDTLFNLIKQGGEPKEVSTLAATLRGYLETMNNLGNKSDRPQIQQQNNYLIFQDLEREKVIEIKNSNRLRYLVDGVVAKDSDSEEAEA